MTTATWDIAYREPGHAGVRILHLAEREANYERALCGRRRDDAPLEPNARGETCVVCASLYFRKHGVNFGEEMP